MDDERAASIQRCLDLRRYSKLTRELLHTEARKLRLLHANESIRFPAVRTHQLGEHELRLLVSLQLPSPLETLARSRGISDLSILAVKNLGFEPLHSTGLIGAILERELWEFPTKSGEVIQNVALSRRIGSYFTPPHIAWYITARTMGPRFASVLNSDDPDQVVAFLRSRILDPSCGCGVFLVAAWCFLISAYDFAAIKFPALRKKLGTRECYGASVAKDQLFGVELSARFAYASRMAVSSASGIDISAVRNIRHGDALLSAMDSKKRQRFAIGNGETYQLSGWKDLLPSGGFDFVLLNPPYGRLRVLRSDYQEKSRASTLTGDRLEAELNERKASLAKLIAHFRASKEFGGVVHGVLDWQRLFMVRSLSLLGKDGRFGMIIPSSILADRSADFLRQRLLRESAVERIDRIAETAKLFPGVNQPTCILIGEKGKATKSFITTPPIRDVPPESALELTVNIGRLERLSETLPIPAANRSQFDILDLVHRFPKLSAHQGMVNARGEFDLTSFREFMRPRGTRLIRGDHVERFQLRSAHESLKEGFVNRREFERALRGSAKSKHIDRLRLVGRQISYLEKARRLSFTVAPEGSVIANSCNYIFFEGVGAKVWLWFLYGLFNSALFEWRFRLTSSNNHVNNYELADLPIPTKPNVRIGTIAKRLAQNASMRPFGSFSKPSTALEDLNDAAIFRLYGVHKKGVEEILGSIEPHRVSRVLKILNP